MEDPSFGTLPMQDRLARWREGDDTAADELLRSCASRLERLARKMLRGFPSVRGQADTGDVVQGATLRLLAALRQVQPASTRDFLALSALQIRRELLDLARQAGRGRPASLDQVAEPASPDDDLGLWSAFHEAVEALPAVEREVVGLLFYHRMTRVEAAGVLGLDERTVRRRWASASARLHTALGGRVPEGGD